MKITFLGTGISMGIPIAGITHPISITRDSRNQRLRTSVWITTEHTSILIDAGPDIRHQILTAGITHIDMLLITHEHMDHIAGLDDIRPLYLKSKKAIPLYTSSPCLEAIKKRFFHLFGTKRYPNSVKFTPHVLTKAFSTADTHITPLEIKHGMIDILGFRINQFAYLTDVKHIPQKTYAQLRGIKVLVLSALRWKDEHPTHLTIPEAITIANRINPQKTYFTHISPYVIHNEIIQRLPLNMYLSFDGLEISC